MALPFNRAMEESGVILSTIIFKLSIEIGNFINSSNSKFSIREFAKELNKLFFKNSPDNLK